MEVSADKPVAGYNYESPVEDLPRNISPSSIVGTPGQRIENITLENVEIHYPGGSDSIYAFCGSDPESLASIADRTTQHPEFSMFKELPAWGLYLRHADNVVLRNVHMTVADRDYRPCIVADDVNGLTLVNSRPAMPQTLVANGSTRVKASGYRIVKQRPLAATSVDTPTLLQDDADSYGKGYKASRFGIKNNSTTLNTNSIQHAINYIAQLGGGCLKFYVGRYLTGTVYIPHNLHIHLREGAIIVPSPNPYVRQQQSPTASLIFEDASTQPTGLRSIE